jgi:potassium/hydrogen antiporter
MIGMLEFATADDGSLWSVVWEFLLEMGVGLVVGIAGTALLVFLMRQVRLPSESLYPLRTLAAAGLIYGLASVAHGSGFLAVFIAGLALGDLDTPYKRQIIRFHTSLASLAEIVVFVGLGLTVDVTEALDEGVWLDGLLLALLLAFVARPLAIAPLLAPLRLRMGERVFVAWGGLKGAVPILLAAFGILAGIDDARRIYEIVFIVVAFSVVVQGSSLPFAAAKLGVRMRPT